MKKQFVYVDLKVKDGKEYVLIKDRDIEVEPQILTRYLREGIRKNEITEGEEVVQAINTKYIFQVKSPNTNKESHYFVVRIKNEIIKSGSPTANIVKSLAKRSYKQTNTNKTRILALATAGCILITSWAYVFVNGLKRFFGNVNNYEKNYSAAQQYVDDHNLPEEANEQYYKDLEKRAKEGDKEAEKEYFNYLIQKQLEQQKQEEEKARGIIRK